jgi:hypothetical protein
VAGSLLGLLLIVVCAGAVALLTVNAGRRRAVLVVVRSVAAGALVERADVSATNASVDPVVHVVPVSEISRVVGRVASVNLVPGTLISFDQLSTGPRLPPGNAVVGLALKPGQLPSPLQPLDRVMLVQTVAAGGSGLSAQSGAAGGSAQPTSTVLVPSAQVYAIGQSADGQSTTVSVAVSSASAPAVAAASAADQISVVLLGGPG